MNANRKSAPWTAPTGGRNIDDTQPVVLTVSLPSQLRNSLPPHVLAPSAKVRHITLSQIDVHRLTGANAPSLILAPLIASGFDAMDVLVILKEIGFAGRYLVLAPTVPDIPLIRGEMVAQAQALDVDVIALGGSSALHEV